MPTKTPIDSGLVARLSGAWKALTGNTIDSGNEWNGPGQPPPAVVDASQREGVVGRLFDYPMGVNQRYQPRHGEDVSFFQMRQLADKLDILRLVIETRKDQVAKLEFNIRPMGKKNAEDPRCKEVEEFLRFPDGENNWHTWLRQLLEEMLVTDAATVYPWMKNGGKPYRFELMDGTTIKRVVDVRGRTPDAPSPAYQQVLKGLPTVDYTRDELIYFPRNKRVHKLYGYSPVEQIVMTVNIAMRRALHQLQYYTEGSIPDLLFQVPAEWSMSQIKEFNDWWQDSLAGNTAKRRKAQFVPNGVTPVNTKEMILKDPMDEWLARIVAYAFSVSAQPFIREVNRATAETAHMAALQEGLQPVMLWVKGLMDYLIWKYFGYKDLAFFWNEEESIDANTQSQIDDRNLRNGSQTLDEVRARKGEDPYATEWSSKPMVLTGNGYVLVEPAQAVTTPPGAEQTGSAATSRQAGSKPATKPESGTTKEEPSGVDKIEKVRKVPPINHESDEHLQLLDEMKIDVLAALKKQADQLAENVVNSKEPITLKNIPFPESDMLELFEQHLSESGQLGVFDAYLQLQFNDPEMLSLANENAIKFAKEHAADLVGKRVLSNGRVIENPNPEYVIDNATREMIRADVTIAMEEGLSNDDLAKMLRKNYAFSEIRAETVARTETALADCNGNLLLYKQSNVVTMKRWIVGAGCCDICAELDGEVVPLENKFSNGVAIPPAHPNCRCDIIPVLNEESE